MKFSTVFWFASLTACSGSGGTPASGADAGVVGHMVAGLAWADEVNSTIVVVDPASPESPRFTDSFVTGASPVYLVTMDEPTDGASGTTTYLGDSRVFYVKSGRVYTVSLRKDESQTARQLSSLTTACALRVQQLDFWSDNAWIAIRVPDEFGSCGGNDGPIVYVRPSMDADAQPVKVAHALVQTALVDSSGATIGFIALEDQSLGYYDAELQRVGTVAGSEGTIDFHRIRGEYQRDSAIVNVNQSLRRLTWTGAGAALSPSLHELATRVSPLPPVAPDAEAVYIADGPELLSIPANGAPSVVTTVSGPIGTIDVAGADAILTYDDGVGGAVASVAKTGGPITRLLTTGGDVLAAKGDRLFYVIDDSSTGAVALRAVDANGDNDALVAPRVAWPIERVYPAAFDGPPVYPDGIIYCDPDPGVDECAPGTLKEYLLPSGPELNLGRFARDHGELDAQDASVFNSGVPTSFITSEASGADMYIVTPGVEGSLVRVTHNL